MLWCIGWLLYSSLWWRHPYQINIKILKNITLDLIKNINIQNHHNWRYVVFTTNSTRLHTPGAPLFTLTLVPLPWLSSSSEFHCSRVQCEGLVVVVLSGWLLVQCHSLQHWCSPVKHNQQHGVLYLRIDQIFSCSCLTSCMNWSALFNLIHQKQTQCITGPVLAGYIRMGW